MNNFDYKVKKTENCALINIDNWLLGPSQSINIQRINGKVVPTGITTIVDTNIVDEKWKTYPLQIGDKILISSVAKDVASFHSFTIEGDTRYYNLPISQIMGVFANDELNVVYDKILIKKIEVKNSPLLLNSNMMVGEVVKVGNLSTLNVGDKVLVTDNVSTEVTLKEQNFYAVEERMVVGLFKRELNIEDITLVNESILLKPYVCPNVLNSKVLITPEINYEDLDYSDLYNRDLFEVCYTDSSLKKLKKGDKVLLNRDYTNYVYYNQEKFHIINGYKHLSGKIVN